MNIRKLLSKDNLRPIKIECHLCDDNYSSYVISHNGNLFHICSGCKDELLKTLILYEYGG